jgi:DNA repair protein RecN (Recombination protein N)
LRDYLNGLDLDPRQLEIVEARLDQVNKLKRKYGGSIRAVLDFSQKISAQLDEMENLDETLARLQDDLKHAYQILVELAQELSAKRAQTAEQLSLHVEEELAFLKMAQTRFAVNLQPLPAARETHPYLSLNGHALGEWGYDRATFMMAPNVGEAIKPLAGVASGGELSRVVLALKAILAHHQSLETVVFDEVDAGIGGATAEVVGQKLAVLAGHHQILCITHLPQIAKYGDHHFRIEKTVSQGRTHTIITPLQAEERVEEIARMLGGEKITPATLAHAREMISSTSR